ncbi:MAG TPA: CinA family nicotinamide mononucleotide deamidase-related protein, partial [Chloroflexia bacterium]
MRAEIVSIGTELLLGTITDTNASYLAQRLALLGIDCFYISQVGDNPARLKEVLARAWGRSDLTVTTGGLGPTVDDLTREAIAQMLAETPHIDENLAEQVRQFFARRGSPMPEANLKQAALIPSATPLDNPIGTAPGWWVGRTIGGSPRIIVSMPGVPFEMKRMWELEVEPRLRLLSPTQIVSRTLKVLGMGESAVEQVVVDLMGGANPTLAPYAKQDGIHLRITAKADNEATARDMIAGLEEQVRARLGNAVYGADDETPAGAVLALLARHGLRLAVVEVGEGAIGSVLPHLAISERVVV